VARYLFQLSTVTPAGSYVRLDSASGSTSSTAVSPTDSAYVFPGAILRSDATTGELPRVAAGVATLYQKTLNASGGVTATATLTGTLVDGAAPGGLEALTFPIPVNTGGGSVSDATAGTKGVVQLAGDLGGTAASPTVPGLASKVSTTRTISAGTGLVGGGDLSSDRSGKRRHQRRLDRRLGIHWHEHHQTSSRSGTLAHSGDVREYRSKPQFPSEQYFRLGGGSLPGRHSGAVPIRDRRHRVRDVRCAMGAARFRCGLLDC
jgi:hypothetical protein